MAVQLFNLRDEIDLKGASYVTCSPHHLAGGPRDPGHVASGRRGIGEQSARRQRPAGRRDERGGAIQSPVGAYRIDLGTLNPNNPGSVGSGRREINWDGVPDAQSSPNAFPPDFFNAAVAGRARGAVFDTPGSGFQVSGKAPVAPIEFDNINPTYSSLFTTFSAPRLFTAVGSTITNVRFFVPGSSTPATTSGFGSVFTDVDRAGQTRIK